MSDPPGPTPELVDGRDRDHDAEDGPARSTDVLILTGMCGAGRSTAAQRPGGPRLVRRGQPAAADARADGRPGRALPRRRDPAGRGRRRPQPELLRDLREALPALRERGLGTAVVFLDATDEVLVRRFESRPPPAPAAGRRPDRSTASRPSATLLRRPARPTPTSSSTPPGSTCTSCRPRSSQAFGGDGPEPRLRATVMSFGFKYGIPLDADFVARHAVPAQPVLGARAARPHRPGRRRSATTCSPQPEAKRVPRPVRRRCWSRCCRATCARASRYVTIAVGCTGGKHRSRGDRRGAGRRLSGGSASRRIASCTATWGASDAGRPARSSRSAAGTAWPRRCGAAAADRPDHGVVTVGGRRRLQRPAARRARRPAAGRPADGAGRAVRRHRVGAHRGATCCSTGSPARDRCGGHARRQPADRRPLGAARRHGRRPGPASAGCSGPAAGCCRWRPCRWRSRPTSSAPTRPTRPRSATVRGQVAVATTPGRVARRPAAPGRPAGLRRGRRRRRTSRLGHPRPGLVVHQRAAAPAGARARARRSSPAAGATAASRSTCRRRPARPRASPPRTTWRCSPRTRPTCASTWSSPTAQRGRRRGGAAQRRGRPRGAAGRRTGRRARRPGRHDPLRLAAAYRDIIGLTSRRPAPGSCTAVAG